MRIAPRRRRHEAVGHAPEDTVPDDTVCGDSQVIRAVRDVELDVPALLAVGLVDATGVRAASLGAPLEGEWEIGSISKGLTGLLYADAVERGEITPTTRLGDVLDVVGCPAADITMEELSQHRSGLPRLPRSPRVAARIMWSGMSGGNPYGEDAPALVHQLRSTRVGAAVPSYSNFGFEALGLALAASADLTFRDLVRTRLAGPLSLASVDVPSTAADLTERAVQGRAPGGSRQDPWTGVAFGPAGGVRASIGDMAALTAGLLSRSVPGVAATMPTSGFGEHDRIGAAWLTGPRRDRLVTWHNGATSGFRSWLGFDRASGVGVVVLAAGAASVDRLGLALLGNLAGG